MRVTRTTGLAAVLAFVVLFLLVKQHSLMQQEQATVRERNMLDVAFRMESASVRAEHDRCQSGARVEATIAQQQLAALQEQLAEVKEQLAAAEEDLAAATVSKKQHDQLRDDYHQLGEQLRADLQTCQQQQQLLKQKYDDESQRQEHNLRELREQFVSEQQQLASSEQKHSAVVQLMTEQLATAQLQVIHQDQLQQQADALQLSQVYEVVAKKVLRNQQTYVLTVLCRQCQSSRASCLTPQTLTPPQLHSRCSNWVN